MRKVYELKPGCVHRVRNVRLGSIATESDFGAMSGLPSVANGIAGIPDWQLMGARLLQRLPSGRSTPGWAKARLAVERRAGDCAASFIKCCGPIPLIRHRLASCDDD